MPTPVHNYLNRLRASSWQAAGDFGDAALSVIYPHQCRVCGAMIESWRDGQACADCWIQIAQARDQAICAKCGVPVQAAPAIAVEIEAGRYTAERRCGRCDHLAFSRARACGPYHGALRESVLQLKLHPHIPIRLRLMLRAAFDELNAIEPSDFVIPTPLHPKRLAERGFNQAEIIARALASSTGLQVNNASLVRAKQTERHRVGMGLRERARSLEKAFKVRAPRLIEGRRLLVVDDVMTTSSTAHEVAQTLLDAGAATVKVLTLARAMSQFIN